MGRKWRVGGLAQGHWLGEKALESLHVALSLTVMAATPPAMASTFQEGEGYRGCAPFYWKAITLPEGLFPHVQWTST